VLLELEKLRLDVQLVQRAAVKGHLGLQPVEEQPRFGRNGDPVGGSGEQVLLFLYEVAHQHCLHRLLGLPKAANQPTRLLDRGEAASDRTDLKQNASDAVVLGGGLHQTAQLVEGNESSAASAAEER